MSNCYCAKSLYPAVTKKAIFFHTLQPTNYKITTKSQNTKKKLKKINAKYLLSLLFWQNPSTQNLLKSLQKLINLANATRRCVSFDIFAFLFRKCVRAFRAPNDNVRFPLRPTMFETRYRRVSVPNPTTVPENCDFDNVKNSLDYCNWNDEVLLIANLRTICSRRDFFGYRIEIPALRNQQMLLSILVCLKKGYIFRRQKLYLLTL